MINVWWSWDLTKQSGPRAHAVTSSTPLSHLTGSPQEAGSCHFSWRMVTKTQVSNDIK